HASPPSPPWAPARESAPPSARPADPQPHSCNSASHMSNTHRHVPPVPTSIHYAQSVVLRMCEPRDRPRPNTLQPPRSAPPVVCHLPTPVPRPAPTTPWPALQDRVDKSGDSKSWGTG